MGVHVVDAASRVQAEAADTAATLLAISRECGASTLHYHKSYEPESRQVSTIVLTELPMRASCLVVKYANACPKARNSAHAWCRPPRGRVSSGGRAITVTSPL